VRRGLSLAPRGAVAGWSMVTEAVDCAEVCVLIVGYDNPDDVFRCLTALSRAAASPSFHIFICENGGRDAYQRLIRRLVDDSACCIESADAGCEPAPSPFLAVSRLSLAGGRAKVTIGCANDNLGYAGGVNAWLRKLLDREGWNGVWILNPDAEPAPDALRQLVARADVGGKAMVGSTILESGSTTFVRFRGGIHWQKLFARGVAIGLGAKLDCPVDLEAIEGQMDGPSGASMYVTRRCIEQIGLMDESYFLFFEDLDWGTRAKTLGLGLGYASASITAHKRGTTTGSAGRAASLSKLAVYLEHRNAIHFVRRYHFWTLPIRLLYSLAQALRFLFAGAYINSFAVLQGVVAGLAGETGRPKSHMPARTTVQRQGGEARPSLDVFMPLPLTRRGPGYTCGMLSQFMAGPALSVNILTPRTRSFPVRPATVVQSLPRWARYVPFKWVRSLSNDGIDRRFLFEVGRRSAPFRAAHIWPDAKLQTIQALKRDKVVVFREMINCHQGTAKTILDEAYARIGVEPRHMITEARACEEQQALEAVDYIFCPNEFVEKSLIQHGLSRAKLVPTSYGWEPSRFAGLRRMLEPCEGITLVFAGTVCVRKGCHLLLDYWASSGVPGRLVLAGEIEPIIRDRFHHFLERRDVVVLDFVTDIGALYRSADVFVFPSLEEGGPQVTYEACGCGLPVITTPMGAGRIVRHGSEGYVLDPFDRESWIAAIRELAADQGRRAAMGEAARSRAELFRWDLVAKQRREHILERLLGAGRTAQSDLQRFEAA